MAVETDINKRWELGIPHHSESMAVGNAIFDLDWKYGGDYFRWKHGGDGDNGEHLMYLLDIYFENRDASRAVGLSLMESYKED